jgi:hypothetical protein
MVALRLRETAHCLSSGNNFERGNYIPLFTIIPRISNANGNNDGGICLTAKKQAVYQSGSLKFLRSKSAILGA